MDIDALSEQTEATYAFNLVDESVRWNWRDIQKLEGISFPINMHIFSIKREAGRSLNDCKIYRKPTMSRPPDRSEITVKSGYDEDRGAFVEGTWTWTWDDKDDKETSSDNKNEGTTPSDPPDSRDRDSDKDVDKN